MPTFSSMSNPVEFFGETAYHMWQLVESDWGCFHFILRFRSYSEIVTQSKNSELAVIKLTILTASK